LSLVDQFHAAKQTQQQLQRAVDDAASAQQTSTVSADVVDAAPTTVIDAYLHSKGQMKYSLGRSPSYNSVDFAVPDDAKAEPDDAGSQHEDKAPTTERRSCRERRTPSRYDDF